MINVLNKMLAPLRTRIANMVARSVINLIDDSKKMQLLQLGLLPDETRDEVERFQNYGFTSVPLKGAEAVVLFVGGRRDHGLAIAVDDRRYRTKNLESGEVAVYDSTGSKIVLKANGDIQLIPHSGKVKVTGDLEASGDVKAGTISLKTHVHGAGTYAVVAAPGPVTAGTTSGAPQ